MTSRFIRVSVANEFETFADLFENIHTNILIPEEAAKCGSLIRAEVNSGEFKGTQIDGGDPVCDIFDMSGVSAILFLVNQRDQTERKPISALSLLVGGSTLETIPDWSDIPRTQKYMGLSSTSSALKGS